MVQIVDKLFERDPDGAMLAFADMMRKQIVMPAHLMNDNIHYERSGRNLFAVCAIESCEPRNRLMIART